ncbi:arabinosyltransferase domain-containing protein [Antrihabitans sp. NCIMB 15449]|uniref:Arabinosyltransferase domain-containing protein n=1 Tax=Antrihabitans spumae TaxID=3373370 RepID=A0ABW7JUD7_9NOCA
MTESKGAVRRSADAEPATTAASKRPTNKARLVAILSASIAVLAALALPFLPVEQAQSNVSWPQAGNVSSVTAPLVSYAPQQLSAAIPCAAIDRLADSGGVVVSTIPRQSPESERYGFVVKVVAAEAERAGRVDVVSRNTLLWSAPIDTLRNQPCALAVSIDPTRATVTTTGAETSAATTNNGDLRPQTVGLFSELTGAAPDGLSADVLVDSRFSSSPTLLKYLLLILCGLATMASLVALHRLDGTDRRTTRRLLPARWWSVRPVDAVVFGTLVVWHFIGANTSDDGYQLGMARAAHDSGYIANYFRWFGVPEAPFGTPYYDILSWMAKLSTLSPWMRLPALLAGILAWWIISREVIPRLGIAVRSSPIAIWTSALVFLSFWLPYNNGLRPEPIVALGVLLTWCSVERAIATRRLLPAAVAILIAGFTLTVGPSGLICIAALIAGARQVAAVVTERSTSVGKLALLLPLLASGLVILVAVFADQTLASTRAMTEVHSKIGPGEPWFFEYLRYQYLLQINSDGWLTRRFGVFVMVLGLLVCAATMLRRGGRIPGTAAGPSLRVVGVTLGGMALIMFNPTKWTHHFGVFAGLAAVVAALTAVAVSTHVLRSLRNRALFAAAVFFALALSFVGANGYWYVSSWGIPWWDKPPTIAGTGLSTLAAGLAFLALVAAAWFHIRPPQPGRDDVIATRIARIPVLTIAAAFMVLFEVLSFVKAAAAQFPAYSIAKSNVEEAFAGGCGLADDVLVENDPNQSMLAPLDGDAGNALAGPSTTGFTPNGVAADLTSDETESTTGQANTVSTDTEDETPQESSAGTGGGAGQRGVNGSNVALPFGLDPATTPVLGSYREGEQTPAALTSSWYRLPAANESNTRGDIIAIAVAGRIRSVNADGVVTNGQNVEIEYGTTQPDRTVTPLGRITPIDIGPSPTWRNLRVPLDQLPFEADTVRIVATDADLNRDQWVAVTPPRVPQTRTLTDLVGTEAPVLLDWAVGLNFPCQNLVSTDAGVAQEPEYRILPDRNGATITNLWQGRDGGGPLGWIDLLLGARTIPSYLDNDWDRDWGSIEQYFPLDPDTAQARVTVDDVQRSGTWSPGPILTQY